MLTARCVGPNATARCLDNACRVRPAGRKPGMATVPELGLPLLGLTLSLGIDERDGLPAASS